LPVSCRGERSGGFCWSPTLLATVLLLAGCLAAPAAAKDTDEEEPEKPAPTVPNLYLDVYTAYAAVPAGSLAIGFRNFTQLPTLSSPASQSLTTTVPVTVDLNDRISVYGGVDAGIFRTDASSWSSLAVTSWNVGFQADVIQQNGGAFPTLTIQSTLSRTAGTALLKTTTLTTIAEFDYALDEDATRGLLAGVRHINVSVDVPLASVSPTFVGYLGGYYQWDNNWKLTGRFGMQSFGGAQILSLTPFKPFTQPIVRLDLDRMDDNDNRLFGVTAEISWMPQAAYQLTLRTPLYAIKN
jgi:hypothetical protein